MGARKKMDKKIQKNPRAKPSGFFDLKIFSKIFSNISYNNLKNLDLHVLQKLFRI